MGDSTMMGLGNLLALVQEHGAVVLLAAIALYYLVMMVRGAVKRQGHDSNLAGDTAGIYQQMLQDQRIRLAAEEKRNGDLQTALISMSRDGNAAHQAEIARMHERHMSDISRLEKKYEGLLKDMSQLREDCERRDSANSRENAALWSITTAEQRLALAEQGVVPGGREQRSGRDRRAASPAQEITP